MCLQTTNSNYKLGVIKYLKEKLPKNFDRALRSLGRVHNSNFTDTPEGEAELARCLSGCKSMPEITDLLAAVAREMHEMNGAMAVYGYSPEIQVLKHLHVQLGARAFPRIEVLNSLVILETIKSLGYHQSPNTDDSDPSTKVPTALADAYSAVLGSQLQGSHTALGDCLGMSRVLKAIQQCVEQCSASSSASDGDDE